MPDTWNGPSEDAAIQAIEAFLREELGEVPEYQHFVDEASNGWAFYVSENDTTSYVHKDLSIEWYGTSWEPNDDFDGTCNGCDAGGHTCIHCDSEWCPDCWTCHAHTHDCPETRENIALDIFHAGEDEPVKVVGTMRLRIGRKIFAKQPIHASSEPVELRTQAFADSKIQITSWRRPGDVDQEPTQE